MLRSAEPCRDRPDGKNDVTVAAPVTLEDHHQIDAFDCGVTALNAWLKTRARSNTASGVNRPGFPGDHSVGLRRLVSGPPY